MHWVNEHKSQTQTADISVEHCWEYLYMNYHKLAWRAKAGSPCPRPSVVLVCRSRVLLIPAVVLQSLACQLTELQMHQAQVLLHWAAVCAVHERCESPVITLSQSSEANTNTDTDADRSQHDALHAHLTWTGASGSAFWWFRPSRQTSYYLSSIFRNLSLTHTRSHTHKHTLTRRSRLSAAAAVQRRLATATAHRPRAKIKDLRIDTCYYHRLYKNRLLHIKWLLLGNEASNAHI